VLNGNFQGVQLAADSSAIYFASGRTVGRLSATDGTVQYLVDDPRFSGEGGSIAVDNTNVYYVLSQPWPGVSSILSVPKSGGTPSLLFGASGRIATMVAPNAAPTQVYFGLRLSSGDAVVKLDAASGEVVALRTKLAGFSALHIDGNYLYYSGTKGVQRLHKLGVPSFCQGASCALLPKGFRSNLALGKRTAQSSTVLGGVSSRAVDGDPRGDWNNGSVTHTDTQDKPWWQVDLGESYELDTVKLFNRTDCCSERLQNVDILLSDDGTTFRPIAVSGQVPVTQTFAMPAGTRARFVRVQLRGTGILSLAEVQVSSPDIALGKTATQSSITWEGDPARAIDGNTNGFFLNGSVTHTEWQGQPWWQLDLEYPQSIGDVVLYNRSDCCSDRLSNFDILTSNDGSTFTSVYDHPGAAPQRLSIPLNLASYARYLRVQLRGTNSLSLAEVEVHRKR
jgi:hypothetical protein